MNHVNSDPPTIAPPEMNVDFEKCGLVASVNELVVFF